MSSINSVTIVGDVGKDPEVRVTPNGGRIARLTIGTSQTWIDRDSGDKKGKTELHRIVIFNDALAGFIEQHVKKGSKVGVLGSLATKKWVDKLGIDRYSTEIVVDGSNGSVHLLSDTARRGDDDRPGSGSRPKPHGREAANSEADPDEGLPR